MLDKYIIYIHFLKKFPCDYHKRQAMYLWAKTELKHFILEFFGFPYKVLGKQLDSYPVEQSWYVWDFHCIKKNSFCYSQMILWNWKILCMYWRVEALFVKNTFKDKANK